MKYTYRDCVITITSNPIQIESINAVKMAPQPFVDNDDALTYVKQFIDWVLDYRPNSLEYYALFPKGNDRN